MMRVLLGILLITFWGGAGPVNAGEGGSQELRHKCFDSVAQFAPSFDGPSLFDETYDVDARGNSYSCVMYTNSEKVHVALKAFKEAIAFPSQSSIEKGIQFPFFANLQAEDEAGRKRLKLTNWVEWKQFRDTYIQSSQVAVIMCSTVKTLTIVPDDGAMIGNGLVWLNGIGEDFGARVMNLSPVSDEAIVETCKAAM
ncbi:MAG: hypothetical protein HWE08_12130 [Alphaproteobacteria bacterium]|nr:hypothetical protein [Alphaproteobacteria bacterium]